MRLTRSRTGLRTALLRWYDGNGRDLPWRLRGARGEPYRVWLSEVMLQQTVAATVKPYFNAFLARWPSAAALAAAPREEVLRAWAGLGYYARARNLHEAAKILAADGFPADEAGWRALPGVGRYTAAAIAAIAYAQPASAVDGNVERVMARLYAVQAPLPDAKPELRALAQTLAPRARPGDWAQALMDLGALVCTPRAPRCAACPISRFCAANAQGAGEAYPRKRAKAAKPRRHGVAFWLEREGRVLLVRRPDKGLLGAMLALPSTPWREAPWSEAHARAHAPATAKWARAGAVDHVFTHFALTLDVWRATTRARPSAGVWFCIDGIGEAGLPSVFLKAAKRALA